MTSEDDRLEDFQDVFNFSTEFARVQDSPPLVPQISLATLFVLIAFVAFGSAGYVRNETPGMAAALLSAVFVVVGASSMYAGLSNHGIGKWLWLLIGFAIAGVGVTLFITFNYSGG